MTPEQEHIFCRAAALGVACGLEHRYEWMINAIRALAHGPYTEIPDRMKDLYESFLSFEKSTASCPEEELELEILTVDGLVTKVNDWYERPKHD